jgi:UDP-glucose 4-epimerase
VTEDLRDAYQGRRTLVTGGLGFIGSHVARRLVELGARVGVVDALVPEHGGNAFNVRDVQGRIDVTIADLRNRAITDRLVRGCDLIFNLAGQVSHVDSLSRPDLDLAHNVEAPLALLEACRAHNGEACIVFASTRQVYGRAQRLPVDETHPCRPVDPNGIHKWTAERYHLLYGELFGLHAVCLRLTNTYGPGQLVRHPRQGFMGWFLRKAVEGDTIEIMGDGTQLRDLNYVDDVVEAMLRAAVTRVARGQVYNLGAPQPVSLLELVDLLLKIAGRGSKRLIPFPEERQRIDIGSVYTSYEKIRAELGWQPRVSLEEGLERSVRHYERHLARYLS